jgi:hypothetical protein
MTEGYIFLALTGASLLAALGFSLVVAKRRMSDAILKTKPPLGSMTTFHRHSSDCACQQRGHRNIQEKCRTKLGPRMKSAGRRLQLKEAIIERYVSPEMF